MQADVRTRAEAAYAAGDLLGALPDYERLVSLFPEEACLHGRLAGCALKEPGRLSLVRRHLRIALRMGCSDLDLGFHQARLAQLEYDFDRARDLYAAYLAAAGKKGRFKTEAQEGALSCKNADWQPAEAVALEVFERIPADPDAAFRYYDPEVEGLRLVTTPASLRSKADLKYGQGRMALHDGDTVLVYSSLGKKGATGWDLYRVSIRQGAYTEPTLLEGVINSEYDEKDAYLSKEGILYYASNRPGGLGGFDIYAVTCGLDGLPTGQPYRLPYPINSVNDDVFFIPEAAGGAWMASNRAAVEGKVHAYRIGLGEGEMATGSIAWSADEVEGEGFKLRVFASGEEVSVGDLTDGATAHLSFAGDESVRIVLEDSDGNVVVESFGAGEGAWELKKTSSGWNLEDQSDVLADWAVLSDLQVGMAMGSGVRGAGDIAVAGLDSEAAVSEGNSTEGWADWIGTRNNGNSALAEGMEATPPVDAPAGLVSAQTEPTVSTLDDIPAVDIDPDAAKESEVADLVDPSEARLGEGDQAAVDGSVGEDEAQALEVTSDLVADQPDGPSASSDETQDASPEAIGAETDSPSRPASQDPWASGDVEMLVAEIPESPEVVAQLLVSSPETVVEIWEERAEQILALEQGFLDEPDFNKAGELYDLLDQMDAWVPQKEMMAPLLQDGVAIGDMRDMLDEWSFAVQSASKASLAKVAGEAALALRRERLAIRELWQASDLDLTPLKTRWSNWRDSNRGLPGTRPEDAVMLAEEGGLLLGQWEAALAVGDEVWGRKERGGWRGKWLGRQRVELELNQSFWDKEVELASQMAVPSESVENANVDLAVAEMAVEELPSDGDDGDGPRVPVQGDAEVSLVAQLLPAIGSNPTVDSSIQTLAPSGSNWSYQWDSAVQASKGVARQWERLARASDGQGVAPVTEGSGLVDLTPAVRSAYLGLVASVIEELDALRSDWQRDRAPLMAEWEEKEYAGMGNSDAMVQVRELWTAAQQAEEEAEALERTNKGDEAVQFDRALAQREALAQAETAWRAWASAWKDVLETEAALAEAVDNEQDDKDSASLEENTQVEGSAFPGAMVPETTAAATAEEAPSSTVDAETPEAGSEAIAEVVTAPLDVQPLDSSNEQETESEGLEAQPLSATSETSAEAESDQQGVAEAGAVEFDLSDVLVNSSAERLARMSALMMSMDAAQQSDLPLVLEGAEREALSAWRERTDLMANDPGVAAGRAARMAWDKRLFFNERRLRAALNALDVALLERKLNGEIVAEEAEVSVSVFEETRVAGGDLNSITSSTEAAAAMDETLTVPAPPSDVASAEGASVTTTGEDVEDLLESSGDTRSEAAQTAAVTRQNADVASYGLILPEAEVWGSSSDPARNSGLTLRPIGRAALERSILGRPFSAESDEAASERFGSNSGAPVAEGVEYKIQIGAFRKALPAALFAAFDPMWAQELSNGITRYMAGSFDLYDPAVAARDAIRALGYEDAFVVRFVDGERVRASRPEPALLADERASVEGRDVLSPRPVGASAIAVNEPVVGGTEANVANGDRVGAPLPTRREDIPTWDGIAGRVYSVQVGAFRGVPDAAAMASLGTLTREDAGSDGWLRLFSGRFVSQTEAEIHRRDLRSQGRNDAFIVVYINGRRIPLSQASLTSVASLPGAQDDAVSQTAVAVPLEVPAGEALVAGAWCVELGVFNSTIPVRLANAILDAPLQWQIRSVRSDGLTRYRTAFVAEEQARGWLNAAQADGFANAQLVQQ